MNELALFAGAGGGILGGHLLGWRTVAAVEIEDYPRRVLLQRQADGILPRFPIWDDVCTFDGKTWRGKVDVISGGFPCQDISAAGKGAGIEGERSGLWGEMARIIGEVRPSYVFVENSPLLVGRGLAVVLGDLAKMGYDARWGIVGAHHVAAPHKRDRIWVLACKTNGDCKSACAKHDEAPRLSEYVADSTNPRLEGHRGKPRKSEESESRNDNSSFSNSQDKRILRRERSKVYGGQQPEPDAPREAVNECGEWWAVEPRLGRVAHGVANRVDRLKAIGNGQVSAVAALAWNLLNQEDGIVRDLRKR